MDSLKENQILKFLKKGEKTAAEISVYTQTNYYKIKIILDNLIGEGNIEVMDFREKKYYKIKKGGKK